MSLRVIGAGWFRTGTTSLKAGLERLLGGECYHMHTLQANLDHVPAWERALDGDMSGVQDVLAGYEAVVHWPAWLFWRELAEMNPDAIIVLSRRSSPQAWWKSFDDTIGMALREGGRLYGDLGGLRRMIGEVKRRSLGDSWRDPDAAMAALELHEARVRAECPPGRLLEWTTADGYQPICRKLGLPVPDEPFPRINTTEQFVALRSERLRLAKAGVPLRKLPRPEEAGRPGSTDVAQL
jgi:hypothetical protein